MEAVGESTTDNASTPFIGRNKQANQPVGMYDAIIGFITWKFSYSTLQLLAICAFCGGMLSLHILAALKWPKGDYGIGVLQESLHCGSRGVAFMAFLISIPLNFFATLVAYALGLVTKRSSFIIQATAFSTIIPTHFL